MQIYLFTDVVSTSEWSKIMVVIFGVIRANEWFEVINLERRRRR